MLAVAGVAATELGRQRSPIIVLVAALMVQCGLIALLPGLIRVTGRGAARLPLPLRLSVRDAVRHRVRTASAVAAVMGATTAVIAMSVSVHTSSVTAEAAYATLQPLGSTRISAFDADDRQWAKVRETVATVLPGAQPVFAKTARVTRSGEPLVLDPQLFSCGEACFFHDSLWNVLVGDERLLTFLLGGRDPAAAAALAAGKAVVSHPSALKNGMVTLRPTDQADELVRVPAVTVAPKDARLAFVLVPEAAVSEAKFTLAERDLFVMAKPANAERAGRDLRAVAKSATLEVETGYHGKQFGLLLVLLGAGALLVLGGTFAATGLAAADMRRDLDTMSAVGARPATRRLVVAAQAGYIAGLGALVGLVAGVVSGAALALPRRASSLYGNTHLAVPWLFVAAVVIGLPMVAALVSGLCTRTGPALTRRVS
ncbi:ABC transporter permease [Nonomuraea sp. NBC_01738]|uniref:ABC transporter permease n=1 Tax=Nonomuraea sp. NBC_01738 TaxID=2976003 RepID=UPI002E10246C|nr:ABC transporter permease [Nonomuraea sp. NBC_01738]